MPNSGSLYPAFYVDIDPTFVPNDMGVVLVDDFLGQNLHLPFHESVHW